jgi:3-oxoacyl-[acyl-carrier-protein] synthase-3
MHTKGAFVTGFGAFLPNDPVDNDALERVLGTVNQVSNRVKQRILINNGILIRHYAIDPVTGKPTHTSAQLTAEAIRALAQKTHFSLENLDCLACGTSSADQIIPAHGSMVHAELGCPPCEVVTTMGVCCAGMTAFKYGYLNVASGNCRNAVVTGSELASPSLTARHFQPEMDRERREIGKEPMLAFENDFLRYMLSDGAGAMLIEPRPRDRGLSLHIDWLDILSFATETDVCMYFGLHKGENATSSYRHVADPAELSKGRYLNLAQDVNILKERMPVLTHKALMATKDRRKLSSERIDWFLPHYSSKWFRQPLYNLLVDDGLPIPYEKWFTNLPTKGNTGSASIYIMLEELADSGRIKSGQRLLCFIPESARMTFAFLHLTAV